MGLRAKAVFTLLAVVIPISVVFSIWRWESERRAMIERRADRFASRLAERSLTRCERRPEAWQRRRRGMQVFAYDPRFSSQHPEAPAFPEELVAKLESEEGPVHMWSGRGARSPGVTAIRAAPSGPCAVLLLVWSKPPASPGPSISGRVLAQTLALALLLVLVGLMISAPLVFRMRRLKDAVETATEDGFDNPEAEARDEIGALGEAFAATFASLQARDAALKEYVANTTHDLAIPLTVLQHRLTKLRESVSEDPILEHVKAALEESHYIASLIANMSAAAKLEARQLDITAVEMDLNQLVERVAGRHAPIAREKRIELNWASPEEAILTSADSTLAEQAVSNLVQNAIQYNVAGGHVSIVVERGEEAFEIRVLDDGPGIEQDRLDDVVTRGFRAQGARTRHAGGQGFGLAIAKEVCERHGWTLELTSRAPEPGTIAVIRGPLAQA